MVVFSDGKVTVYQSGRLVCHQSFSTGRYARVVSRHDRRGRVWTVEFSGSFEAGREYQVSVHQGLPW